MWTVPLLVVMVWAWAAGVAASPIGQLILFGFVWSLVYHFFSGFRHLAWDFGFGFAVKTASGLSFAIYVLATLATIAAFALVYLGKAGYLQ